MKRYRLLIAAGLAVLFFGAVLAFSGVRPAEVVALFRGCDPSWLLAALAAYAASYAGRALRFKLLLKGFAPPYAGLLCTATLHNLFNAAMPARTGELSYIYLVRTKFRIPTANGVASLVAARVLDLACIMAYLGMGLIYYAPA